MKTATLSPPPRPPKVGRFAGGLGEPDGGKPGGQTDVLRWGRMFLKFAVVVLFVVAVAQLAFVVFQIIRLWFFS